MRYWNISKAETSHWEILIEFVPHIAYDETDVQAENQCRQGYLVTFLGSDGLGVNSGCHLLTA